MNSDKENEQPGTREHTPRLGKARGLRGTSARMPTPESGSAAGTGSKRRRVDNYSMGQSQVHEDEQADDGADDDEDAVETPSQSQVTPESDEEGDLKFYNPNQDPEKRRKLRATMRDHQRMVDGMSNRRGTRRMDS
jgi:hypothetical protein